MLDIARLLLLGAAGTALYFLVRTALGGDRWMRAFVLVGFLGRAFLSVLLFWVSYLFLPVAQGLQMERGLWFFAVDSRLYLTGARQAVAGGLDDILRLTASTPSAAYVQALAVFSLLFGDPIAVSLLLNLFCYAGACAIIVRWSATFSESRNAARIALAAISLSPSGVLWAMQPLKDTFFQFLIVAFFGACFLWQRAWRMSDLRGQVWLAGGAIVVVHHLISGVRWYVGFMMLAASVLVLPIIALTLHRRRLIAAVAAVAMLVVLSQSLLIAGGEHIPRSVRDFLQLRSPASAGAAPLVAQVEEVRSGFDRLGGNTTIRPVSNASNPKPAENPTNVASRNAEAPATGGKKPPTPASGPPPNAPSSATSTSGGAGSQSTATQPGPEPATTAKRPDSSSTAKPPATTKSPATAQPAQPRPRNPAPVEPPKPKVARTDPDQPAQKPPPARATETGKATAGAAERKIDKATPKSPPAQTTSEAPVAEKAVKPEVTTVAKSAPSSAPSPATASPAEAPTRAQKLIAGAVAAALPRTISDRLGLVHIGEGRGFFWFTELDTLFFDVFLLLSLISIVLGFRRASPRNGVFWLVVGVTILMAIGLAYAITNFGTMFRHRVMVLTGLALIPLALATFRPRETAAPLESEESTAPAPGSA